ncbi:SpvB/TcaC N-terminal domain-containing protein [Tenacibaculum sp. TC6]|uniref:SpvB/TcaC N-terminal domain-containing protein n=1 Tax=Tenacibaculum sp. TC6 TaxID=3423223 RepID=UPI003D360DB4
MKRLLRLILVWSPILLFIYTTNILANNNPERYYPAKEKQGYIGTSKEKPIDSPTDNSFTIQLSELPKADEEVFLTYELYGITDHTGISHSINNQFAVGGHYVKLKNEWTLQEEQIHSNWLSSGANYVRFTLPENANYHYEVRNVGLKIKKKGKQGRSVIINQPESQIYIDNIGYIKGFVDGNAATAAKIYVEEKEVQNINNAFEILVNKDGEEPKWSVDVKAVFPDGEIIQQTIYFTQPLKADRVNRIALPRGVFNERVYQPNAKFNLSVQGAKIEIPIQSLKESKSISITALRSVDIPVLDMGMVNVTSNYSAYRFLPHGTQFSKEATIELGYDKNKIPEGYTANDIKTYFYDEVKKHWVALPKDSLLIKEGTIISKTTHFTDMINGIIKVPESPETAGFTPTSIKDIKSANPSAAINMIGPPNINNMGSANVGYPIVVPAGRQGMQPSIGIQYNSSSGNGWLGVGWDLQIPSIAIDTRWGVPRYSTTEETETYSMGGQMLTPVAHRGELQPRTGEKQFYPRVEGSFNKIIRHGNNPTNYWWEVTDKSGTIYSYGGTQNLGIVETSILKDADGNIAHWALVEVRDLNDNFVRYHCTKVEDTGIIGGTVPGYTIYVNRITYTGHGNTEGKYEVTFTRDRELGESKRIDVNINARFGFKQVTADLLRKIEVKLNGQNIRHYELNYKQGAFYKTLLEKITEFDANGQEFTNHTFDYYDDVKASEGYKPLSTAENWTPQDDHVRGSFINPLEHFNDDASALSGTKSNNFGFGLAITFGIFDGQLFCKSNTLGGDFGYGESTSDGILSLIDINGDGLSDKVFMNGNGFSYRPNESGPNGTTVFGDLLPISGINKFYKDKSSTTNYGFQLSAGCADFSAFIGLSKSKSKSQTTVYFTDVNGDQLIDIAVGGQVFFNHIDADGKPVFTTSSADTPSPVFQGGVIDSNVFTIDPQEIEDAIDQNPLHDVIRMWEAPYDGIVAISGGVNLKQPTEPSGTADGVRVTIQHVATELWNTTIPANDYGVKVPTGVGAINVTKGDRIYFRVQSVFDGTDDQVNWSPVITYSEHIDGLNNANDQPIYQFTANDDFLVSGLQSIEVPIDGGIVIEGTFTKPVTSDDIVARITKESDGTIIWEQTYTGNQTVNQPINLPLAVQAGDSFSFSVEADTNIDWSDIGWTPRLYYTTSSDPNYPTENLTDVNGNPTLELYPSVFYTMFTETIHKTVAYEAVQDETITIDSELIFTGTPSGMLTFSVKKVNELIAKQKLTVVSGVVSGNTPVTLNLVAGEKIFLEYHVSDKAFSETITQHNAILTVLGTPQTVSTGLFTVNDEMIFGPQYRNWGQFAYNGNRNRATQPINETELKLDDAFTNGNTIDLNGASTPEELEQMYENQGGYNPASSNFIMMIPDTKNQRWQGYDNLTYVEASTISSSRMGQDDLSVISPIPASNGGSGASAINKITETKSTSYSLGGGVGGGTFGANGSYSKTQSETRVLSDFMDMNGDSYPDIVTESHIQYTNAIGGLVDTATAHNFGVNNLSHNESDGVTLGGTYATADSRGTIYNIKNRTLEVGKGAGGGLSGNFAKGENEIEYSWKDVNGDGLPDRVYEGGNVALNLGYKFAPVEPWGYLPVQEGKSKSYGAGLGINIGNNSIAGGISLSRSESEGKKILQDVNGDGLVDELILGTPIQVRLNTGNGFAGAILWDGANAISENSSTSESANVAFTLCIPLPTPITPAFKLCFNPSANVGQGASRELTQIQDIDGDGYPDLLQSTKDNNLTVKRSTIGRTNMLKSVERPLGASFTVNYNRVGNTYNHPSNVWAMTSLEVHDGFEGDGADIMRSSFEYEDGFYDRHERDFYGFRKIKSNQLDTQSNDAVYRTVVQEYSNTNYYEKGLLVREALQDANENLYTETINTFELKDINSGTTLPDTFKKNDALAAFPAAVETTKNYYEGGSSAEKSMRMTYAYDVLGNVIGYTDFGEPTSDDDISSTITYHSISSNYIMNSPSGITVTAGGQIYRKRETDIDTNTGNVTQIRKYLADGSMATSDMEYDTYGNITKMTRPANEEGERLFLSYQYDNEVQTYPVHISDGYGYSSSSEYDYRFGQVLFNTELNGQQMRYTIDDVGRITTITGPFELTAGLPYTIAFEYHPEATVPWTLTKHYDPAHPDNDLETVNFIDGLGRKLQTKKDGTIHVGPQVADAEKMIVSGRVTFDAFGRSVKNYYPVIESKGNEGAFNVTYDGVTPTNTAYDVLDRPLVVTLPDATTTQNEYGFGSDRDGNIQFKKKTTDANGIWKESFTNVRGLSTAVLELYSQGTDIWTSYKYNPINELVEVRDAYDNLTSSKYDWLGRRTEVTHPDSGTTLFKYDLTDNLTQKITANLAATNTAITYKYDYERLKEIIYPHNPQNNVKYTYGDAGAEYNRAGRIVLQEDATGAQEFFYSPLGAVVKNIRTIVIPDKELLTFTTEWTYDTWNRITEMVYPDSEKVTYTYNLGGKLTSLKGIKDGTEYSYLKQLDYDKFEQRVYLNYGNNTETFYSYEPDRRRLKTMEVETAANRKIMDNVYTYDKVNNILRLQNNSDLPTSNLMGGQTDYVYEYDDLYRLTKATGSHLGSNHENKYSLIMEYDAIHNITKKEQLHQFKGYDEEEWSPRNKTTYNYQYTYGEEQPHAPIEIGEKNYTYDVNGNQTGWTHDVSGQEREILWDEENRIKAIADNGALFSYVYDANNERVLKNNGGGQNVRVNGAKAGGSGSIGNYTIYVNPYVVVRNSQVTKHFYIENQRIVTKLAESSDGLLQPTAGSGTNNKVNYMNKQSALKGSILKMYADLGLEITKVDGEAGNSGQTPPNGNAYGYGNGNGNGNGGGNSGSNGNGTGGNGINKEAFVYYYHPDHVGSSSYITDANGEVTQHIEYFAFGETFLEEHSNTERTPYLFNGKELDEETGLYYYGNRYYDPHTSVWQSVDPLAEKFPNRSPYSYSFQNPVKYTDPNGELPILPLLIKAGAAGAADMMAQATMAYLFDPNVNSIGEAFDSVNWWQVGRSSAEGLIPWRTPGGRLGKAAATAVGDVLVNALDQGSSYTKEQALQDFAVGFIGDLAGGGLGDLVNKYGADAVAKGLKKIGFDDAKIKSLTGVNLSNPCKCFAGGTKVLLESGAKSIEDIEIGDSVWTYNTDSGEVELKKVTALYKTGRDHVLKLYVDNEVIETTDDHEFYVKGEWVEAGKLATGTIFRTFNGKEKVLLKSERIEKVQIAYNFTVDGNHNYFASQLGILVHNSCGFYHVKGGNNITSYVGKGGERRARVSLKQRGGSAVEFFEVKQGVAGLSVDKTALVMEQFGITANGGAISQGGTNLLNAINSPGAKIYKGLTSTQKAQIRAEYNRIISGGAKVLK